MKYHLERSQSCAPGESVGRVGTMGNSRITSASRVAGRVRGFQAIFPSNASWGAGREIRYLPCIARPRRTLCRSRQARGLPLVFGGASDVCIGGSPGAENGGLDDRREHAITTKGMPGKAGSLPV